MAGERDAAHRVVQRLFGDVVGLHDLARLTGASHGASIWIGVLDCEICLEVHQTDPVILTAIWHLAGGPRQAIITNRGLDIYPTGPTFYVLRDMVRRQCEAARCLGVTSVAARSRRSDAADDRCPWLALGFDARLSPSIHERLPHALRAARTLRELLLHADGAACWREVGVDLEVRLAVEQLRWKLPFPPTPPQRKRCCTIGP